ncbi:MAG: polyphenol oxidase [Ponticaulis sp.]|nr:polyphenol oxidase [Ponticaulis sp.]
MTPPFLRAPRLASIDTLSHGFFGREGGVSSGVYDSLNVGPGSKDRREDVMKNREIVAHTIGAVDGKHLISLYQTHSPDVVTITEPFDWESRPYGDAMITTQKGLALCILTADCTPVLFADPVAGVIGVAHAGWKGALAGVLENTVAAMEREGASAENILAAIGPSLSPGSFEVGPDLKTPFVQKHAWAESCFTAGDGDRSWFDIWSFCERILSDCGIKSVESLGEDSLTQPNRYFSNRYCVKHKLSDYGRNASVIMLR